MNPAMINEVMELTQWFLIILVSLSCLFVCTQSIRRSRRHYKIHRLNKSKILSAKAQKPINQSYEVLTKELEELRNVQSQVKAQLAAMQRAVRMRKDQPQREHARQDD
jgi:hypothetical protein